MDVRIPTPAAITHFRLLVEMLPFCPIASRKVMMTVVQTGTLPWQSSRMRHSLKEYENTYIYILRHGWNREVRSLLQILVDFQIVFSTPTLRAITSVYLRTVPIADDSDWRAVLESGKKKELGMTQTWKLPSIQFPYLGNALQASRYSMHASLPFTPHLNLEILDRLRRWKHNSFHSILLPKPSTKTMGEHSSNIFNDFVYRHLHPSDRPKCARTTLDLETFYMESGLKCGGPAEVRYAWTYNILKPRIYYAQGGDAYFGSRYITHPFNSLAKQFRCTSPQTRYSFSTFGYFDGHDDVFMIYDYTCFTSALADFKVFVNDLGQFCMDQLVRIFDTHEGVKEIRLGQLFLMYNDACNLDPEFSIHRIEGLDKDHPRAIVHHRVAGMLGVFGNIVGSTVLHGLVTLGIIGTEEQVNVVGDDAAIKFKRSEMGIAYVQEAINVIGSVATEKFEVWDVDETTSEQSLGWHYVKRPITVRHNIIVPQWMPDFPIIARCLGIEDNQHTVPKGDFVTRRRLLIKQTCRLFDQMYQHKSLVNELDVECTLDLLRRLYHKLCLPVYGSFPRPHLRKTDTKCGAFPDTVLCIPVLCEDSIRKGWFSVLKERSTEAIVVRVPCVDLYTSLPEDMVAGDTFVNRGSEILGLLWKIGILTKEKMFEDVLLTDEILRRLDFLIKGRIKSLYTYTVLKDYAPWNSYMMY